MMIGIIFDMDGVIYRRKEVIEFLKSKKISFVFLTNNSIRNARMYREKLKYGCLSIRNGAKFRMEGGFQKMQPQIL